MSNDAGCAKGLRVGIVGGSIAGCVCAVELSRAGCEVMVFERSRGQLEDRGAGIASSNPHLAMLKERDLIDTDYPAIKLDSLIWTMPEEDDRHGNVLMRQPGAAAGMSWGLLFAHHRKRVPDEVYHPGCNITGVEEHADGSVTLLLEDGRRFTFDLVVFADGYQSWGREYLFPEVKAKYAGYVIWRGLVDEARVPAGAYDSASASEWAVHEGGLCVFYPIPGPRGGTAPGQRMMNWAWYNLTPESRLPELLTDKQGRRHENSLPQGAATAEHVWYIHNYARRVLRGMAADIIRATAEPFIQVIYDLHVPAYARGRICLVGDASSLARPHTAAGAIKAQLQAIALSKALQSHGSPEDALRAWNEEVWAAADKQVSLGKVLGRALVTEAPDWRTMDETRMTEWWKAATSGVYVYYSRGAKEERKEG